MIISMHPAFLFERYGIDEGFAMLKACGIGGIQFGMGAYVMPQKVIKDNLPSVMDGTVEEIIEFVRPYKEAADKHGIAISQVHAPFPMWMPDNPEMVERMKSVIQKSLAVTAYMESPHCVVHPAFVKDNTRAMNADAEWALNKALYAALISDLQKYDVQCLLENMFSQAPDGARFAAACADFTEAARWIDELNALAGEERFGFCFDTGHCHLARQNLYRGILIVGPRIKALHLQDNSGYFDQHLAPYMGTADFEGVLNGLREIGYRGDLNFETGNVLGRFPPEVTEECLRLTSALGRYFMKRIAE